MIQKEQALQKRMETRALNVCRSGPCPEYAEDSEEDEAPFGLGKLNTSQGTNSS